LSTRVNDSLQVTIQRRWYGTLNATNKSRRPINLMKHGILILHATLITRVLHCILHLNKVMLKFISIGRKPILHMFNTWHYVWHQIWRTFQGFKIWSAHIVHEKRSKMTLNHQKIVDRCLKPNAIVGGSIPNREIFYAHEGKS
jgi:hypothetical protein